MAILSTKRLLYRRFFPMLLCGCLLAFITIYKGEIAASVYANYLNLGLLQSSPIPLAACALHCPEESYVLLDSHRFLDAEYGAKTGHLANDLARLRVAFFSGRLAETRQIFAQIDPDLCASRLDCLLLKSDFNRLIGDEHAKLETLRSLPGAAQLLRQRGDHNLQSGDLDKARQDYLMSVAIAPDSAVYYRLGEISALAGVHDTALDYFALAIELNQFTYYRGEELLTSLTLAHAKAGTILLAKGDVQQAQLHFEAAVFTNNASKDGRIYLELGKLYRDAGRHDDAIRVWRKGVDVPTSSYKNWLHFSLARHFSEQDDWRRSVDHYERGLALAPDHPSYYNLWGELARVYLAAGDYDNAKRAVQNALILAPENQESQNLLTEIEGLR